MVPTVADQVKLLQTAPEATVTVLLDNPELESKTTSSDDVGAVCPPAPPEKFAQFVVDASQVPDPPTQYLVAENDRLEINKKKNRILIFILIVYLINEFL